MHTTFNPANTDASKADKDVTVVTFMVIMLSAVIAHTRTPITDTAPGSPRASTHYAAAVCRTLNLEACTTKQRSNIVSRFPVLLPPEGKILMTGRMEGNSSCPPSFFCLQ